MERNHRERDFLDTVTELFDLPPELAAGLPRLEMLGNRQMYLEHHSGILSCTRQQIDINTSAGVLRITGQRLELLAMTAEEVRIGGQLDALTWVR